MEKRARQSHLREASSTVLHPLFLSCRLPGLFSPEQPFQPTHSPQTLVSSCGPSLPGHGPASLSQELWGHCVWSLNTPFISGFTFPKLPSFLSMSLLLRKPSPMSWASPCLRKMARDATGPPGLVIRSGRPRGFQSPLTCTSWFARD